MTYPLYIHETSYFLAKTISIIINCTELFHTSVCKCKLLINTVEINNTIPSTFNIIAKILQYKNVGKYNRLIY